MTRLNIHLQLLRLEIGNLKVKISTYGAIAGAVVTFAIQIIGTVM